MKIGAKNLSWTFVSHELKSLFPDGKKAVVADTGFTAKTSFKVFTPQNAPKEMVPQESALRDLDLELLREFAKSVEGRDLSYHGFIASQLQHSPVDENTKLALTRAMAVKRMMALVNATVEEMRAIELRRICFNKG